MIDEVPSLIPSPTPLSTRRDQERKEAGAAPVTAVLFSHSAGLGGAERCLLETAQALQDLGVEFVVVLPDEGPLRDALADAGADTHIIRSRPWLASGPSPAWKRAARLASALPASLTAAAFVARRRPTFVYSNTVASPVGALAARLCRVDHVWHLHEFAGGPDEGPFFAAGARVSLAVMRRIGGRFVGNSRVVAEHYAALLGLAHIPYVYQPVTAAPASRGRPAPILAAAPTLPAPEPGAGIRCLMLGAIEENKNQEEAVRALALLRDLEPPASLTLAGPARQGYLARLRAAIAAVAVGDRVKIVPEYVPSAQFLATADVVLVCSHQEAFGRVTVEAMKAGRVVVGARSGGTAELIRDGETGLLYDPGKAEDLAAKIRLLALDGEARDRLGSNARAWAGERFTRARYARDLAAAIGLPHH
jgi:glycosyltransferase involved in cell wall biosynthesis